MAIVPKPGAPFLDMIVPGILEQSKQVFKWNTKTRDYQAGDIVYLREEPTAPTRWPLAKVIKVHSGQDGKVRVVTVWTTKGAYVRLVVL